MSWKLTRNENSPTGLRAECSALDLFLVGDRNNVICRPKIIVWMNTENGSIVRLGLRCNPKNV
jgi:hypothetical protein